MADKRTIAVVTGSRADYGLVRPVMRAIHDHADLELRVIVTGTHLLPPEHTAHEVERDFTLANTITMQRPDEHTRLNDAEALGRGVTGFAQQFARDSIDVMLVLGDRIEALAAAAAASVAGIHLAHMHGGDRAEGIADEAIRHAITKLAHIHFPATDQSAKRLESLGEDPNRIHVVGSPAIDELADFPPLSDETMNELGWPEIVMLLHPTGQAIEQERDQTAQLLELCQEAGKVLAIHPNHDPGRDGIVQAITEAGCRQREHLPRRDFIGLLRRIRLLVGNSSAGLIEGAALGVQCVNIGSRQAGRDMCANVINVPDGQPDSIQPAIARGLAAGTGQIDHAYGDGQAGIRTAAILATFDPTRLPLVKRNTF